MFEPSGHEDHSPDHSEVDTTQVFSSVLLIEDDQSHAKLLLRMLRGIVGEVHHVMSAQEALKALENTLPELVFCDLHLPDMHGLALLRAIHEARPGLPVIVMTSSSSLEDAVTAMREGASDYMVKQFSDDLRERFQIVVRRTADHQLQQMREFRLRAERDAFWGAVRTAQDGLSILDNNGSVIFSNEAFDQFAQLLGSVGERNALLSLIEKHDPIVAEGLTAQLFEQSENSLWRSQFRVNGPNANEKEAKYFELSLTLIPIGGKNAEKNSERTTEKSTELGSSTSLKLKRYVLWVHDITTKKTQEKFQRDLLSTTSHDLKGPLGAIVTSAELLGERTSLDEKKKQELVMRIASCARSAISLIDELLSARRIQDGLLVVKPKWYEINDVLEDIVLDYLPLAKAKNIGFRAIPTPKGLKAFADKIGLHRVLGNLVSNAIKFTPVNGSVELSAEHAGDELRISVRDTGPGIESESRHMLFQRYARLDKHQEVDGTGLGLFVTKNIVDAHNGRIEVQSQVGVGTTFTVCFPDEVPVPPAATPSPAG